MQVSLNNYPDDAWLSIKDVTSCFGKSQATIYRWLKSKKFPPKISGAYWLARELKEFKNTGKLPQLEVANSSK